MVKHPAYTRHRPQIRASRRAALVLLYDWIGPIDPQRLPTLYSGVDSAMTLLTTSTAKIDLSKGKGVWEAVLYLSPALESVPYGGFNTCPSHGACVSVCLGNTSGLMVTQQAKEARVARTMMYREKNDLFHAQLRMELERHYKRALKAGYTPAFRFNGSSDLFAPARMIATWALKALPKLKCYDYTKIWQNLTAYRPSNYSLVYSFNERSPLTAAEEYLQAGGNVAVTFQVKKGDKLPKEWNGYRVIDGDTSDARFKDPKGVVVGLRAKGKARVPGNPFVVIQ